MATPEEGKVTPEEKGGPKGPEEFAEAAEQERLMDVVAVVLAESAGKAEEVKAEAEKIETKAAEHGGELKPEEKKKNEGIVNEAKAVVAAEKTEASKLQENYVFT